MRDFNIKNRHAHFHAKKVAKCSVFLYANTSKLTFQTGMLNSQ